MAHGLPEGEGTLKPSRWQQVFREYDCGLSLAEEVGEDDKG